MNREIDSAELRKIAELLDSCEDLLPSSPEISDTYDGTDLDT